MAASSFDFENPNGGSSGTPTTRSIATTAPLAGGGDLSADRTLSLAPSGQAAGDLLYYNGSAWVRLAKGSDGQVLTLASGTPAWATPAAPANAFKFQAWFPTNTLTTTAKAPVTTNTNTVTGSWTTSSGSMARFSIDTVQTLTVTVDLSAGPGSDEVTVYAVRAASIGGSLTSGATSTTLGSMTGSETNKSFTFSNAPVGDYTIQMGTRDGSLITTFGRVTVK